VAGAPPFPGVGPPSRVGGGWHTPARSPTGVPLLHVHHADRADALVGALADVLADPPADPFAPEVVAVHSRGIERWIAQRLSHHLGVSPGRGDGVAANVRFPFPGALVGDAVARATGTVPARDPWRPERLVWPLLDVVDEAVRDGRDDLLGPLRAHVADRDGHPSDRRLGAVRRVAELFDRYAVHRPAMLRAWADRIEDDDGSLPAPVPGGAPDLGGDGQALAPRYRWQPQLWRAVHRRLPAASGPERLAEATTALARSATVAGDPLELELPDRLAVFGVTALSATTVEVLAALAAGPTPTAPDGRDVHVFLLHPSPGLWRRTADLLAERGLGPGVHATAGTVLPTRDDDPTRDLPRDPLLTAWARDTRELQLVVSTVAATSNDAAADHAADGSDDATGAADEAHHPSLLRRLQDAVRDDLVRDDTVPLPLLAADDRSVQLHRCHGAIRQVEALRDVLYHLLADDPTLEPRDVIVLCPDIETFAPLVTAVFGRSTDASDGGPVQLPVQLADRSLRRTNPLLRVVAEVLDLAAGRVTGSEVLDLCTRAPVRARFDLDEDDLGRLESWLEDLGVRWGLDEDHRRELGVPTDANTWRTGLDRLLVGVTTADEQLRTALGVTPEDDVEGDAVELAGRFAELLDRLHDIVSTLRTPRSIGPWLDALGEAVERLCAVGPDDGWQQVQLERVFREVREAVTGTPGGAGRQPLSLTEVRQLLGDQLEGAPSRAAHRTGDVTVCTLVPMRSVPHRVVVLLGMDDEVFPRRTIPDGDDLLAASPLVGDRDPRSEDRQLLLDALLAASDHLVVLTDGHDARTGEARPPAVPIGELLDVIDRTVATDLPSEPGGDGAGPRLPASAAITVDHPLQPFDPVRFRPAGLGHPGHEVTRDRRPFGFDRDDLAAATALTGDRQVAPPFLDEHLAPDDDGSPLELRDLTGFLHHPLQALLAERLDVRFPRDGEQRSDALPVELSGLGNWAVGDRLLAHALAGRSPDRWLEVEAGRGSLPPGDLRDRPVDDIRRTVALFAELAADAGVTIGADAESVAVDVELPGGRRLVGSVAVVGHSRVAASYSRLSRRARLSAWVDVLALTAAHPEHPWCAITLGRAVYQAKVDGEDALASLASLRPGPPRLLGKGGKAREVVNPLGDPSDDPAARRASAVAELTALVAMRDRGLCGPLLLPCDTAGAYAETSWGAGLGLHRRDPFVALRGAWETDDGAPFPSEDADHAHQLLLGSLTAQDLLEVPPTDDEAGDGWHLDEPSRIGRLGRRVWWPLLAAEEVEHR
jgi:exodeoxyribonuclease V gamma subunit